MFSISGRYKRTSVILMAALLTGWPWHSSILRTGCLRFRSALLRIGFEQNPPLQFHTPDGLAGLGVETVSEAAKRAGLRIQWVETGATSEESFRRGWLTSGR